jgi:hypothetical protein
MRIFKLILLLILTLSLTGCLESKFELAQDSRIPKWFDIPKNKTRSDLVVKAEYYSSFHGGKLVFKLYEKGHFFADQTFTISTQSGADLKSVQLNKDSGTSKKGYPRYKVLTINGRTDIIEHRKMEPIFYTTDDPVVWEELAPNINENKSS